MPNKKISEYSAITTLVGADLFEVSQHVSGSTYTSKKITVTDMLTVFAGVTDHGALTGLGDNDHPQYLLVSAVNDTIEAAIANAPTGTGSVVLSASPTFTGTVTAPTYVASTKVTTPLIDTASGDLQIDPASKIVQIGTGTLTSTGVRLGYSGTSGYGGMWSTNVTPGVYKGFVLGQFHTYIGSPNKVYLYGTNGTGSELIVGATGEGITLNPSNGATSITGTLAVSSTITTSSQLNVAASGSGNVNDTLRVGVSGRTIAYDSNAVGRHYALAGDSTGSGGASYLAFGGGGWITFQSTSRQDAGSIDLSIAKAGVNAIIFGGNQSLGGTFSTATSRTCVNKAVASIADNTATTVFTVTIPNAAHSASIRVRLIGSSGAGGAIGANESTQEAEYLINICRTAGVNAVFDISTVRQPAAVTVAGGTAVAVSATLGTVSGAVGATNTFTIQVTIARAGSTADNHTCLCFAELLNANATGVSIA